MKNTTLLKVLSATAIFSAIAAIEAYDQDNFTFAAETPVVASNSAAATAPTATTPATTTTSTTPAHNAEEPATVAQDVKALKDGEYNITAEVLKFYEEGRPSMAAAAIDIDKTKLIVKNGQYSVNVSFKPITFGGLTGYLGNLKYYDGDKTHENRKEIQDSEFKDSTIVENYSASETDNFVDVYKKEFPGRTVYPKTVNYNVDKNKIDSSNKLETYTEVYVPVMASIDETYGTQRMILKFDLSNALNTVTNSQPTPAKPAETPKNTQPSDKPADQGTKPTNSASTTTKPVVTTPAPKTTPAATQEQGEERTVTFYDNVTASLLNSYEAGRASMGNAALDGITVYKDGDTYHYIVRFHDIKIGTLTDGIKRFWVNGTEYPVNSTGGAMNQVQTHFTSNEKLTNIPVSVFVPTMESIMPGAGKKDAILSLNWSNATERQGKAIVTDGQPGVSAAGNGAGPLTPKGGRLNNGRLSNTGLETSSSILAGALTLISAFIVYRRKQNEK